MKTTTLTTLALVVFGFTVSAQTIDLAQIQARMKQRLPQIVTLKEAKAIGENRLGYLEIVDPARTEMKEETIKLVVSAENDDRKTVYIELAGRVDSTPEAVGKARAKQIYNDAKPGVLLKTPDNQWVEKPATPIE